MLISPIKSLSINVLEPRIAKAWVHLEIPYYESKLGYLMDPNNWALRHSYCETQGKRSAWPAILHGHCWGNLSHHNDCKYPHDPLVIWAPVKILYISVVAIIGYRFFWQAISLSRVLVLLSLLEGGPIALQCFVHISCNPTVVFNHFDRNSHRHMITHVPRQVTLRGL